MLEHLADGTTIAYALSSSLVSTHRLPIDVLEQVLTVLAVLRETASEVEPKDRASNDAS